jgi:biotin-dependent carboxylase-like uncharacterized protein
MTVEVLKPGLATTVQDAGRPGYYHLGIPLSGALDQYSFLAANLLVGNDEGAAVLEAALMGPELLFHAPTVVAVTGAQSAPRLNGTEQARYRSFAVQAGDRLSFGPMRLGARIYIAFAGGVDVPLVLGSRSTYGLGAFGGYEGRRLAALDRLPIGRASSLCSVGRELPAELHAPLSREVELRTLPGLYDHRVTAESLTRFHAESWTVGAEADRIAYRFKGGQPLEWRPREQPFGAGSDPSNIVDAGYPYGSIQVPGGVEPIVLHRDAVSGGGYAMIGTVISADMDLIGQLQPNCKARFVPVDMDEALAARAERAARVAALRAALA